MPKNSVVGINMQRVLVTGADGFIGKNLLLHFAEMDNVECISFTRENNLDDLLNSLAGVDWIIHLAGINRPKSTDEFIKGNIGLTEAICNLVKASGRIIPIVFASSIQVNLHNDYGRSKLAAEEALLSLYQETDNPVYIFRLPNVFGKFSRPNYNSVVATFCHNIARNLPIQINDPAVVISLVYIDDLVESFKELLFKGHNHDCFVEVSPSYEMTVGDLAKQLKQFKNSRDDLVLGTVGKGLIRALYSTYLSYLPPESFLYPLKQFRDERGLFVEMLKTTVCGQFSFFSAHPGVTRGGHYHHTKTEKFLIIKGKARFRFRHMATGEYYELDISGDTSQIVETAPGWTHDVTNISNEELICMLWANEIFDQEKPDTFPYPVNYKA